MFGAIGYHILRGGEKTKNDYLSWQSWPREAFKSIHKQGCALAFRKCYSIFPQFRNCGVLRPAKKAVG